MELSQEIKDALALIIPEATNRKFIEILIESEILRHKLQDQIEENEKLQKQLFTKNN